MYVYVCMYVYFYEIVYVLAKTKIIVQFLLQFIRALKICLQLKTKMRILKIDYKIFAYT